MPGFYAKNKYDLAGFCVGIVDEEKLINGKKICEDDLIIALQSNGIHSNGFSLVRKIIENNSQIDKQFKKIHHLDLMVYGKNHLKTKIIFGKFDYLSIIILFLNSKIFSCVFRKL